MIEQIKLWAINTATRFFGNRSVINEHFVPKRGLDIHAYIKAKDATGAHHLVRYLWAQKVLETHILKGPILDIACGAGYGAFLLAQAFPSVHVVGADYDQTAIRYATKHYRLPNLEFRFGDVLHWQESVGATQFFSVVSFDTIEHCRHRELMLENLVDHLMDDGLLLLSTPSGHSKNLLRPRWPHHMIEYSAASLYDLLSRYFQQVERSDEPGFPQRQIFDIFRNSGIAYHLWLNPVLCSAPIRVSNPYKPDNR
ncbi:MAG: class I SAM-dependent methyltransferase [Caldilinea sp.]